MLDFSELYIGQLLYIIEDKPVSIIELEIIEMRYNKDYERRIKLANKDISFELDFDDVVEKMFNEKDVAYAVATKYILDETNKYIRELTDGYFIDYFELDKIVEKYKQIYPELFI